jgi:DNA mismatch endonuclease (patch repair protein)
MTDKLTPQRRSENMRAIRSKGMAPELAVRQAAHALGYRFRLHRKDLPGKPDLVFASRKKVIFVHGCFWHQHPDPSCKIARLPKSNLDYWLPKLQRNALRDKQHIADLEGAGWSVLTIWECEAKDRSKLDAKLAAFLEA